MATTTRIYSVTSPQGKRLVRAVSRHQAIGHVARSTFQVEVADSETLVELVGSGIKVEDIKEDHETKELSAGESV